MQISPLLARASVLVSDGDGRPLGTGYLVAKNLVATCHHVIKDWKKAEVTCWFRTAHQERQATVWRWSEPCDSALLRLDEPPDDVQPLELAPPTHQLDEWSSYAYPGFAAERAVTLQGRICNIDDFDPEYRPTIELYSEVITGEQPEQEGVGGISGSAVMSEGRVIGHILRVLGAKGGGKVAHLGTCYAVPSGAVQALLSAGNDGPVEDACVIVKNPRQKSGARDAMAKLFLTIGSNREAPEAVVAAVEAARAGGLPVEKAVRFAAELLIAGGNPKHALAVLADDQGGRADQMRALALSLTGDHARARAILRTQNITPETGGIEGGVLKRRWIETKNSAWLEASYEAYESAYRRNKGHEQAYYPGINVAALALYLGRDEESRTVAREVEQALAAVGEAKRDHWWWASLGEARLLLRDVAGAVEAYGRAVADPGTVGHRNIAVMRRQARENAARLGLEQHERDAVDAAFPALGVAYLTEPGGDAAFDGQTLEQLRGRFAETLRAGRVRFGYCTSRGAAPAFVAALRDVGATSTVYVPFRDGPPPSDHDRQSRVVLSDRTPADPAARGDAEKACELAMQGAAREMAELMNEPALPIEADPAYRVERRPALPAGAHRGGDGTL